MFYDLGQGQGWQRNIVMDGSPHLPSNIRQWYGDSRGHWERNTLVIDVTNFSPKTDFRGSREHEAGRRASHPGRRLQGDFDKMQGGPTHCIAESYCVARSCKNFSLKQRAGRS